MKCRHCASELDLELIDLGVAPPSNAYLRPEQLRMPERHFPLRALVCSQCWLVQTEDYNQADELFDADYAYFSAFSSTWLKHAETYVASMCERFRLGPKSNVVEIAANDGYLLQYVVGRGIPCYGVEPTARTAEAARGRGIEIVQDFFGVRLAGQLVTEGRQADLIVANNVLAHVPDINDFAKGFAPLLKPDGVATFEFPHLVQFIDLAQFDTIYHEHYSYLSLHVVERIFAEADLTVFDVEQLPTHGGSLRVFAQRSDSGTRSMRPGLAEVRAMEAQRGVAGAAYYTGFQTRAARIKDDLLLFLIEAKRRGEKVAAYGAAAKGNTLLNYAGVRPDLVAFVADRNPAKQGKFMPGSRIPIVDENSLRATRPDWVLILPWNLKDEIAAQLDYVSAWGGHFVVPAPALTTFP